MHQLAHWRRQRTRQHEKKHIGDVTYLSPEFLQITRCQHEWSDQRTTKGQISCIDPDNQWSPFMVSATPPSWMLLLQTFAHFLRWFSTCPFSTEIGDCRMFSCASRCELLLHRHISLGWAANSLRVISSGQFAKLVSSDSVSWVSVAVPAAYGALYVRARLDARKPNRWLCWAICPG